MAMTEERRLKKIVINLMRQPLFADWSGILMLGKKEVRDDISTACTDGRDELYGRKFMQSLNDKELAFVVLHEAGHKMLRQLTVWRRLFEENPRLANAAMDYVVNLMLHKRDPKEEHIAIPRKDGKPLALLDMKYDNMNTKQVFDKLKEQLKKQQCKTCGGTGQKKPDKGQKGNKSKGDQGDESKGKGQQDGDQGDNGQQNGQGHGHGGKEPCPDCGGSGQSGGSGHGGFDEHDWPGAKEMSKEEQEKLAKEVDQAIRQGQIAAQRFGLNGTGGLGKELGDLLDPKVDWRELLREFVTSTCAAKDASSWRKVNRRFISHDVYLPSLIGESVENIVICPDMSGSTWCGDTLQKFFSEMIGIANIVKPQKLDLIYWDTQVTNHETFRFGEYEALANITQPKGGGGTNPMCVSDLMKKEGMKPDCIIMLTDGEVPNWGSDWPAPILWVIVNPWRGNSVYADCGQTIHLED